MVAIGRGFSFDERNTVVNAVGFFIIIISCISPEFI